MSSSSAQSTTQPPQPPSSETETTQPTQTYRLPSEITLKHSAKLAIVEDKPVLFDYWSASLENKALIGVRENGEKLLVKSEEEYTSPISKFYKSASEYIIITENSIYLVSVDIQNRRIS
jgi:hypothetical protein